MRFVSLSVEVEGDGREAWIMARYHAPFVKIKYAQGEQCSCMRASAFVFRLPYSRMFRTSVHVARILRDADVSTNFVCPLPTGLPLVEVYVATWSWID